MLLRRLVAALLLACTILPAHAAQYAAVNPVSFGADPTGINDSAPALNAALAASDNIAFPPGRFKFLSPITYNLPAGIASVTIDGAGADATTLYWPSGPGLSVNYSSDKHSLHLRDLTLSTGAAGSGTALTLHNSVLEGTYAQTDIERVTFRGDDGGQAIDYWATDIDVEGVSNINFDGVLIYGNQPGTGGVGIALSGNGAVSPNYGLVYNIDKSGFYNLGTGLLYGPYIQGVTVNLCNFTNGVTGIAAPSGESGVLAQLTVQGSQFNVTGNQIQTLTPIDDVTLTGNLFYVGQNTTGVYMPASNGFQIVGNQFTYNGGHTGSAGIIVGPSPANEGGTISGNLFLGLALGAWLQSGSTGVNVQSNTYPGTATKVTDNGTGNTVGGASP